MAYKNQEDKQAYMREYYLKNKEQLNTRQKRYNKNNRKSYRARSLRRTFNLTIEEYQILWDLQKGLCAICGGPEVAQSKTKQTRWLCVDHNHKTEEIRGLLCHNCNVMLGLIGDDPIILRKAAEYLEK